MNTEATATARPNLFRQLVETANERANRIEWYSKEVGHLYLIRIEHRSGKSKVIKDSFLKIGISKQCDVHSRFNLMPQCFQITVIADMVLPYKEVVRLEKELHRQYRNYRYTPKHKRWGGKTECFRLDLLEAYPSLPEMIAGIEPLPEPKHVHPSQSL